jgi:muconolactone delta-isomerase
MLRPQICQNHIESQQMERQSGPTADHAVWRLTVDGPSSSPTKVLQEQGKWLHLWRVAGKFANVSIFDVESPAELHEILNSLPLYPFIEVDVTALCHHPGAIAPDR